MYFSCGRSSVPRTALADTGKIPKGGDFIASEVAIVIKHPAGSYHGSVTGRAVLWSFRTEVRVSP